MGAFDQDERDMLNRIADSFLPSESPTTGQKVYDFAGFLDTFLSAFDQNDQNPPRIYAGGPYSNRHQAAGAPNDFKESLPLSRYQRLAWKLRLNGPDALTGSAAFTPEPFVVLRKELKEYTGLNDVITDGVRSAIQLVRDLSPKRIPLPDDLLLHAGPDFRGVIRDLVADAAFSAPEYGGNLAAWAEILYPGDTQPAGYPAAQVSNADPDNPFPPDLWAKFLLTMATLFEHGKVFK